MNKTAKLILNIVALILYGVSLVSFFTKFIYVWVLRAGELGAYKGYELAFNFDGMPQNLGTLFPLLVVVGTFIFSIIALIKKIATFKKAPKERKGGSIRPLMCAIFFVLFPLITFFLSLSTFYILNLPAPKKYGGYYMGVGPYLVAYCTLIGGIILFAIQSGIFDNNGPAPVKEEKKEEAKPAPKAAPQPVKAAPVASKPVPQTQAARPVQPQAARPAQPVRPAAPQPARPTVTPRPAAQPVRPGAPRPAAQPARPGVAKPAPQAKPTQQVKK